MFLVFRIFDKVYGLAGMPICYTLTPLELTTILRGQGLGDAEALGRLNIAADAASLADSDHVRRFRALVAQKRAGWNTILDELRLPHTDLRTNFIFFHAGERQTELADALRK